MNKIADATLAYREIQKNLENNYSTFYQCDYHNLSNLKLSILCTKILCKNTFIDIWHVQQIIIKMSICIVAISTIKYFMV